MKTRKILAAILILLALTLGIMFYLAIDFPTTLGAYLKKEYYTQFGPLAISIELLIAGIYLYIKHSKTNFAMALFGFTALLDPIFNLVGLFSSQVPIVAAAIFVCCALLTLWLAFSDTFNLGRISFFSAFVSFILGNAVELFFNYY
ncbi:MAG: hypothetical protein HKP42_04140 [Maribacter sp.]|nr:hypothetical protein [Maribacter sp.]MBT8302092.1 hypothetical protein [Maribacter sp.]NNK75234.1 hypothetical protein [Maribacter sp.]